MIKESPKLDLPSYLTGFPTSENIVMTITFWFKISSKIKNSNLSESANVDGLVQVHGFYSIPVKALCAI